MRRIILISCSEKKLRRRARAEFLYTSPLFKLSLAHAKHLNPNAVYILSAKHGLLPLSKQIKPYDCSLKKMKRAERIAWSKKVLQQLTSVCNPRFDHFIFLAGRAYSDLLLGELPKHTLPLADLAIGKRLQFLKRAPAATN